VKASLSCALVLVLAAVAHADNPVATFKKAYDGKDEAARLAAVAEIAKIQSRVVVTALAPVVARDPSPNVRRAAAKALGAQYASTLAAQALGKAIHADDDPSEVTLTIVAALGETQSDAAVGPLVRLLKVRPRVYAGGGQNAKDIAAATTPVLNALKKVGSCEATGDLVGYCEAEEPGAGVRAKRRAAMAGDPLLKLAVGTLTALTGETYQSPEDWSSWWAEKKGSLVTVPVLRCEVTGKIYDKPSSGKVMCPECGCEAKACSSLLKTRYENVPLADPAAEPTAKKKG
jgi:hypothetical protein